jgi:hypothetical protein
LMTKAMERILTYSYNLLLFLLFLQNFLTRSFELKESKRKNPFEEFRDSKVIFNFILFFCLFFISLSAM